MLVFIWLYFVFLPIAILSQGNCNHSAFQSAINVLRHQYYDLSKRYNQWK